MRTPTLPEVRVLALVSTAVLALSISWPAFGQDLDLSALPEGKSADVCVPRQDYALKIVRERDAAFGAALEEAMTSTASLRDRVGFLLRGIAAREALIDQTELAYSKGSAEQGDLRRHIEIRSFLIAMSTHCGWTYQEFLKQNHDEAGFIVHRDAFVAAFDGFVVALRKERADRRKTLGLPPEQGVAKPSGE